MPFFVYNMGSDWISMISHTCVFILLWIAPLAQEVKAQTKVRDRHGLVYSRLYYISSAKNLGNISDIQYDPGAFGIFYQLENDKYLGGNIMLQAGVNHRSGQGRGGSVANGGSIITSGTFDIWNYEASLSKNFFSHKRRACFYFGGVAEFTFFKKETAIRTFSSMSGDEKTEKASGINGIRIGSCMGFRGYIRLSARSRLVFGISTSILTAEGYNAGTGCSAGINGGLQFH